LRARGQRAGQGQPGKKKVGRRPGYGDYNSRYYASYFAFGNCEPTKSVENDFAAGSEEPIASDVP
jgi:hypothetical protein